MRVIDIFRYFAIGYDYRFLLEHGGAGIPVRGPSHSLLSRLKNFYELLDDLDLQVTKQASNKLRIAILSTKTLPKDAKVDESLAKKIKEAMTELDKTLDAELKLRTAYIVTPKRFDLNHLLHNPGNLFATSVFKKLPPICQYDFTEACLCIAFGRSTAAVFHILRGTEGVLRHYYYSIVKRQRIESLLWHHIIVHLRKRRDAPKKSLLDNLDNLRFNYRNPTQHPEARFDMDDAQDILSISIDVVNQMIKDIDKRTS